jgi:hypothetical protein
MNVPRCDAGPGPLVARGLKLILARGSLLGGGAGYVLGLPS